MDRMHTYTHDEIYNLALQSIKQQYPTRFDHVIIVSPGEFEGQTYTFYESKTTTAKQEGWLIRFPYVSQGSSVFERVLNVPSKRVSISEIMRQLKDNDVDIEKTQCDLGLVELQESDGEVVDHQEEFIISNQTKICQCEECKGAGYLPCPDKECHGRHEYTCPQCEGKGKVTCKECYGDRRIPCPKCGGKGEEICRNCKGEGSLVCKDCGGKGEIKCRKCNGQGRIKCVSCNGAGYFANGVKCSSCFGNGYLKCQDCLGKGYNLCPTCKGNRFLECQDCGGHGKIVCDKCEGKKKVTCPNCHGDGVVSCNHCDGNGVVVCKICFGDKEHYGMVICPTCQASGNTAQIAYVATEIKHLKNKQSPMVLRQYESISVEKVIGKNREQKTIYKNINGKAYETSDTRALELALSIDKKNGLGKASDNPRMVRQDLFYRDVYCVMIKCQHVLTRDTFFVTVVDVFGNPHVLFPDYDRKTKLSAGLFESIGYAFASLFKTPKHIRRVDNYCMYKLYIGLVQVDGVIDENEKRLLIDKLSDFNLLTPHQKNNLWEILNSDTPYVPTEEDVCFSSKDKASEALTMLVALSEIDGNTSAQERAYITRVESLINASSNTSKK